MKNGQASKDAAWGSRTRPEILVLVEYLPKWRIRATLILHLPHGKAYRVFDTWEGTSYRECKQWIESFGAALPRITIVHPGALSRPGTERESANG